MLEQRIMKCPSRSVRPQGGDRKRDRSGSPRAARRPQMKRSWLWVSAALFFALGCSLNPRPEDPGIDRGSDIPGDFGAPSHSPADASAAPPPSGTGGTSNQGGFGGGFTGGGGAGASGPVAVTDGAAEQVGDAAGSSDAGTDALDGGADARDAAAGDGG